MLKKKTLLILSCMILLCSIVLSSCDKKADGDIEILKNDTKKPLVTQQVVDSLPPDQSQGNKGKKDYQKLLANTGTLPIYCINDDGSDIEPVDAYIDANADINSSVVTEAVVKEFANHNVIILIDSVSEDQNGNVKISFKKNSIPVIGVDEELEYLILDCFSQSILDNMETVHAVIFRIEGKAYVTDNVSMGKNEAYDWR